MNATKSEAFGKGSRKKKMAKQTTEVRRCYDVSFKLRGVEVAKKESKASAASQLKVYFTLVGLKKKRSKRPSRINAYRD